MARDLLGKYICTCIEDQITFGKIVETEAYRAPDDRASHAYQNRLTQRTKTMFNEGGIAYVYLCYGIHHLFNVVTGPKDMAHVVLIRAIDPSPSEQMSIMQKRRQIKKPSLELTNGPGKLTQALGITVRLDGTNLYDRKLIWLEDRGVSIPESQIQTSPRVGIDYAGECAARPWRFTIRNHPYCSHPKPKS